MECIQGSHKHTIGSIYSLSIDVSVSPSLQKGMQSDATVAVVYPNLCIPMLNDHFTVYNNLIRVFAHIVKPFYIFTSCYEVWLPKLFHFITPAYSYTQ